MDNKIIISVLQPEDGPAAEVLTGRVSARIYDIYSNFARATNRTRSDIVKMVLTQAAPLIEIQGDQAE